jgi:hypothetical protein
MSTPFGFAAAKGNRENDGERTTQRGYGFCRPTRAQL